LRMIDASAKSQGGLRKSRWNLDLLEPLPTFAIA